MPGFRDKVRIELQPIIPYLVGVIQSSVTAALDLRVLLPVNPNTTASIVHDLFVHRLQQSVPPELGLEYFTSDQADYFRFGIYVLRFNKLDEGLRVKTNSTKASQRFREQEMSFSGETQKPICLYVGYRLNETHTSILGSFVTYPNADGKPIWWFELPLNIVAIGSLLEQEEMDDESFLPIGPKWKQDAITKLQS